MIRSEIVSLIQSLWRFISPPVTRDVEGVYAQSFQGARFLGAVLVVSLVYSLSVEYNRSNTVNVILTLLQIIVALLITAQSQLLRWSVLQNFSHQILRMSTIRLMAHSFGLLMGILAILEMETQFHDLYFYYFDARSWLTNLALMAAFSFFHIGPPVQFITVWLLAYLFYFARILFLEGGEVSVVSMASTIIPLSIVWMIVNAWWFHIRLKYIEASEKLKAANEKLKEIDRFRSNFFAGISHEFRTPLTLILSPLQAFLDKAEDEDLATYLRSVRKNGNRLLTLVNNLIDLARLDSGRMDLHLEAVDVCELVRGILGIFHQSFRSRGLTLKSELPLQLLTKLDVEKTETVLFNLLSNALKFTEQGGATVRVIEHKDRFTIRVEDTGPGIAEDHRAVIFERFGSSSRSGSGLGLALSRELARFMNGDLILREDSETGSVFDLILPLYPVSFKEKQALQITSRFSLTEETACPLAASGRAERPLVLIVEDDMELRHYLMKIIGDRFAVSAAADGASALELASAHRPDVVITDIVMPAMNGFELLQRFRASRDLRSIPFLFLTARAGLEDRLEGLRLGGDDYLVKPFDPPELLEKISVLIRRKRAEEAELQSERRSFVGDLHDVVGSDLTDLLVLLDSMQPDAAPGDRLMQMKSLAQNVLAALRNQIHEREDMQLIQDNFMLGVKVILNRRYAAAGRGIRFRFDSEEEKSFVDHLNLQERRLLYAIFLEITTNDIRYGRGTSMWYLTYQEGTFCAAFEAESTQHSPGRLSFMKRLKEAGGSCSEKIEHGRYTFRLTLKM